MLVGLAATPIHWLQTNKNQPSTNAQPDLDHEAGLIGCLRPPWTGKIHSSIYIYINRNSGPVFFREVLS